MQIAQVQIEIGDMLGAKKNLLMVMDQILSKSAHVMPQILQKLAIVQAQMGDMEEAKNNLLSAKEMLLLPPEEEVEATLLSLEEVAKMQAEIEDIQGAKKTLSDIYKKQLAWTKGSNNALIAALKVLATLK